MNPRLTLIAAGLFVVIVFGGRFIQTIEPGWVGVATIFGEVVDKVYTEGLQFPVNPLYKWTFYDTRQKSLKESITIPTRDQLRTNVELSIQYRLIPSMAQVILRETGDQQQVVHIHLIPTLRSLAREEGSKVHKAEDFFLDETRRGIEVGLLDGMKTDLQPKGIEVQAVLIRDIVLPKVLSQAIEEKKKRQQEVEKQKAELERFREEQQQQVAAAEAKLQAAEQEALQIRVLAQARADEIRLINDAISKNSAYIKLRALDALTDIAKDPAAKIYFLNSDSPQPLPLMNIGDSVAK